MSPRRRLFLLWFGAGLFTPLALWALSTMLSSIGLRSASWALQGLALGSCPFWVLLWLPAMSQPTNSILFYLVAVAVLLANGCFYLAMGQLHYKLRTWTPQWRIVGLALGFPALMALGYLLTLGTGLV